MSFTFPTTRQSRPNSYVATVVKVYEGFNANYGPNGRNGLYIKIKFESTGNLRDIFYPEPPSMKADKLLEALEELEIDLGEIGWEGLTGYIFRFETETVSREIYDKQQSRRRSVNVQLEFPAEVIKTPDELAAPAPAVETSNGATMSDYEAFKDEIAVLAHGKKINELRLAAATTDTVKNAPVEFRQKLNSGIVLSELKDAGRLVEEDGVFTLV